MNPTITKNQSEYNLTAKLEIPKPIKEVFSFFSNPENLKILTPSKFNFKILCFENSPLQEGSLITHQIKIRGIPLKWTSLITKWDPPYLFEDVQKKGPYKQWIHQHIFHDLDGRTIVEDSIKYKVLGGEIIHNLFVKKDLISVFNYRTKILNEYFS